MHTAERLFNEMKTRSETKPDLITFSTLIKGFCKDRHIDSAFKVLNEMKRANIEADEVLFNSLLDGCFRSNEIDLAFRV
jgi:pentatricopeptide repeat protein